MLIIISYDVSVTDPEGRRRLRKVAKLCQNYGFRVQNSVFECNIDPAQWISLKNQLLKCYAPDFDSLRFYNLGSHYENKIEHHGKTKTFNADEAMIL